MTSYIVAFEWPTATKIPAQVEPLEAASIEEASVQAALLFSCEPFPHGLPTRYRVFDRRGGQVFCYPGET